MFLSDEEKTNKKLLINNFKILSPIKIKENDKYITYTPVMVFKNMGNDDNPILYLAKKNNILEYNDDNTSYSLNVLKKKQNDNVINFEDDNDDGYEYSSEYLYIMLNTDIFLEEIQSIKYMNLENGKIYNIDDIDNMIEEKKIKLGGTKKQSYKDKTVKELQEMCSKLNININKKDKETGKYRRKIKNELITSLKNKKK